MSPATSPVKAERGRRSLEVSLVRDWEPNRVYVVEVRPLFRDLFGNQRREPIRLVFSTGAAIPETAVAGFVRDPLTAEPAEGARIEARSRQDSAAYVAIADSSGFFALSYLPPGAFDLTAWLDQDRDRATDFFEAQDTAGAEVGVGDTVVVELAVLPRDSTPARLARAEAVDSVRVRLVFDDYFPVGEPDGRARLFRAADSSLVSAATLLHGARLDSILAAEREARAALEAARRADSLAALGDTIPAEAPADTADPRAAGDPGRVRPGAGALDRRQLPLPSRELIMLLPAPLTPDSTYIVVVEGVTNIRDVPGGGGTARFVAPPLPPPPEAPPPDTTAGDTAATPSPPRARRDLRPRPG
ncbi:MAG: hypothetical protein GWN71_31610 [Gammaproteobacteria bacterium]|nr:carboxypeptidase regulatory-like domain-containing protein [Gemmatimonadota bacterium]NIU77937.1 hypothetical protein [Gammaproteobacteria bacterium]NIY11393.1 hypothetical protein [Gemmatimonadota bacterium]